MSIPVDPGAPRANMPGDLLQFVRSSFRSVWALEVLLKLKRERRPWAVEDLVASLRASELVVTKALDSLAAAGLVSIEAEGAQYMPINEAVASCVEQLETIYGVRPDAVRREIVSAAAGGLSAFADAFRLRKE